MLAISAPEGDDFQKLSARSVVDVVPDTLEQPAAGFWILGVLDLGANARGLDQEIQRVLQVRGHCARRG